MVVDMIFPGWVPFKSLAVAQDIPGWIRAQDVAMSYPWTTLVGGHLGRLGTRADGLTQIQYVADLQASTRATIASLDPTPFFPQYAPNAWAIFKAYLDAVSAQAAGPVIAKYTGGSPPPTSSPPTTPTSCSSRCGSTTACSARSEIIPSPHQS